MSVEALAVHEAAHAVALLACGYTPEKLVVTGEDGGYVTLPSGIDEQSAAVCGLSGGIAVAQILGADADASHSASDCEPLRELFSYGRRQDVARMVDLQASRLVAEHTQGIVDLANYVLSVPQPGTILRAELSKGDIGRFVKVTPSLQQFARLYDGIRLESRRPAMKHLRPTAPRMSAAGYLADRLEKGHGRVPPHVNRLRLADQVRQAGTQ